MLETLCFLVAIIGLIGVIHSIITGGFIITGW